MINFGNCKMGDESLEWVEIVILVLINLLIKRIVSLVLGFKF